ncbi:MbcA/ParS/Xre antitoxin family protein (plasmid) [Achromobacter sp. CF-sbj1-Ac2-l]|jgi:uncharacterized protein (DUF2384 family)|uniref:MbcA/ParS/Xre antitoxin family protein n=1 Tax=Achromobacter TaxID=222 RepID=UPI0006C3C09B|nr:MbcA/ParS/Xre antitoxin family protein [Achromobacter xylosoxidans]CUJ64157.1 Uncharacterised protein [Achromobacter xylosoxidans]
MTALSFSEQFRDGNTSFVSPKKLGNLFGFQLQDLADRAHIHRNTVTRNPRSPELQSYLSQMLRVLYVATSLTGSVERAAYLVRNEPLPAFEGKTADQLIQEGRAQSVVDYLISFEGGAAG